MTNPAENPSVSGSGSGPPVFHSRFGGLWPDRQDADEELDRRLRAGCLTDEQAEAVRAWMRDGACVIRGAVPLDVVDRVRADIEALWARGNPEVFVEEWTSGAKRIAPITPNLEVHRTKVLDLYAFSDAARDAIFSPAILSFLDVLFDRPPLAFQSLMFQRGTAQPMHQDTAFVGVASPLEFVGSWLALEDIQEGSGELEYYLGSHRTDEYLFDGKHKRMPPGFDREDEYLSSIHVKAAGARLERITHRPRKGDVVVWHADLAHGGSAIENPDLTRWSLVTHYCPFDVAPDYFRKVPHTGKVAHASGAYYCAPRRWARSPWARLALSTTRLAKTAFCRLTRGA